MLKFITMNGARNSGNWPSMKAGSLAGSATGQGDSRGRQISYFRENNALIVTLIAEVCVMLAVRCYDVGE